MITILQQGTETKYKVKIKDFDMQYGEFKVSLIYGYRRTVVEILKSQMVSDDDNNFYFTFDTDDIVGKVIARCEWIIPDDDYPDNKRTITDEQFLCFVAPNPCPKFITCPACTKDSDVTYTLTDTPNLGTKYYVMCDYKHNPIVSVDDEYLLVLKEKEE